MLELIRDGAGWRALTVNGSVTAATVIAAANAYTGRLLPGLRHPAVYLYGGQSATQPLPPRMRHILPQRQGFPDLRKKFFRLDPQDRLIIGGPGGL